LENQLVRTLETRIPPPLVTALLALGMWLVAQADPGDNTPGRLRSISSAISLSSSAILALGAFAAFWQVKTTINPFRPERASTLVTHGVYRLTRNPMYVSLFLLLLAYAIELWSLPAFAGPVAFVAFITRLQIIPEERALEAKFGAPFAEYKRRVRRWL
jgi:protein-S-isoprenylcysteine O-methyltransferase Ste14